MSLNSGKRSATELELRWKVNDKLKEQLIMKEIKRKVLEDQISYHDSIRKLNKSK